VGEKEFYLINPLGSLVGLIDGTMASRIISSLDGIKLVNRIAVRSLHKGMSTYIVPVENGLWSVEMINRTLADAGCKITVYIKSRKVPHCTMQAGGKAEGQPLKHYAIIGHCDVSLALAD
jgi:hypothetical protein